MTLKRAAHFLPLIGANIVPLVGVLFLGWDAWQLLFVYWGESVVIAVFGWMNTAVAGFYPLKGMKLGDLAGNIFILLIFLVFFLGFLFVIGGFLQGYMFMSGVMEGDETWSYGLWPDPVPFTFANFVRAPLFGVAAFALSQLYSFVRNFLVGRRYEELEATAALGEPLKRIVMMHLVVLIGGAWLARSFSARPPNYIFLLWIGAKVLLDLYSYVRVEETR